MKEFMRNLSFAADYKNADTVNHEGFPAFQRKGLERLREILFCGHTGNTFYVKSGDLLKERLSDLEKIIQTEDVEEVANIIVSARNNGFFRHLPILALALLRKQSPTFFQKIFNDVIRTGQDLSDFLTINRIVAEGFGRSVKMAIQRWLSEKVSPFYALKYRKQICDGIRISRPKVDIFENKASLSYAYALVNKEAMPQELPEQIKYAEEFKKAVADLNIGIAIEYLKAGKLPADLAISLIGNISDERIWLEILNNMGVMQALKYLNKLSTIIDKDKLIPILERKLTPINLAKAKVFPYRIFIAFINAYKGYVKDFLRGTFNEYLRYLKESITFEKWQRKKFIIAPDVSGSMTWDGVPQPCVIAGFFSATLRYLTGAPVIAWDTDIYPIKRESFWDIYKEIYNANGGGTSMYLPIEYAFRKNIEADVVVIITDSEHWYGDDVLMEEWKKYKKIYPTAKLVVIEVVGYGDSQVNETFAAKYDVYTVFGWSDSVIKWIEFKVL